MKRIFIVITILVLTAAAAIALGVDRSQTALAQHPQPPDLTDRGGDGDGSTVPIGFDNLPDGAQGGEIKASPSRQMSYQGKLEIDGSPASGPIIITFRLLDDATSGTTVWEETQTVSCENGLFSVMLGSVNPLPYAFTFQSQLWLSIQPQGAASELLPRQPLGTVGYAMNLIPGATMLDENPAGSYKYSLWVSSDNHWGIYGSSAITDGVGIGGYAFGPHGYGDPEPTGVYGYSDYGIGVNGESGWIGVRGKGDLGVVGEVDSASDVAVYGMGGFYTGTVGVEGVSGGPRGVGVFGYGDGFDAPGVYGFTYGDDDTCNGLDNFCNGGVVAQAYGDSYGTFSYSKYRNANLGVTDSSTYYAAYFSNYNGKSANGLGVYGATLLDGNLTVTGSKSGYVVDVALNAGFEPLERGDVVVVTGMDAPILGEIPVMRVEKAKPESAAAIVGVVDQLWEPCDQAPEELEAGEACGGFNPNATSFQPGQYISVVTLGAFQWLKVDASTPIHAGDLLSISPTAGVAARAVQITIDGYSFYAPGTIIGKALQDLDSGTGVIAVFVSLK